MTRPGAGLGRPTSDVIDGVLAVLDAASARAGADPGRREWLLRQRRFFTEASASGRVLRDPALAGRVAARAALVRAVIDGPR